MLEVCKKYGIEFSGNIFLKKAKDVAHIAEVCQKYGIEIYANMYRRTAEEIEDIIIFCKKNNIELSSGIFYRKLDELEDIIKTCKKHNVPLFANVFKRTSDEVEKICFLCKVHNIPVSGSVFLYEYKEFKKKLDLCLDNKIDITSSVFTKKAIKLEDTIKFLKEFYGDQYLKSLIIIRDKNYLKDVFAYLDSLGFLPVVINSASILSLTLNEIKDRKEYIESIGEEIVVDGKFNSIFGLSNKNYQNRKNGIVRKRK